VKHNEFHNIIYFVVLLTTFISTIVRAERSTVRVNMQPMDSFMEPVVKQIDTLSVSHCVTVQNKIRHLFYGP
jgi:hypothetical protein